MLTNDVVRKNLHRNYYIQTLCLAFTLGVVH